MSLKNLNKAQRAAVEAVDNPVLIFAGAGSGKTRVITHKISYLINQGLYRPEEILAVTFTNKAAREMRERVEKILKQKPVAVNIGTFHAICARLLRQEIHRLGYTADFAIYDTSDQVQLMKLVLDDMNISKDLITPVRAQRSISTFRNQMIMPEDALRRAGNVVERVIAEIYPAYLKKLKDNNAVDFDDLLILPLQIFEKHPAVLKKYQSRWKYILVDEYQDTNRPQFLLISQLAEKHRKICVVGDDDQSIYGWRGADVKNILDFEKIFSGCEVYKLEKNYRSTQKILSAATDMIRNNEHRAEKELMAVHGSGERLGLIETQDELEEADAVVIAIEKEIKVNKRKFGDFAVLYRTNAQSRALEDSLMRLGIPYDIVGGIRFYERKEIKDFLSYLQLIINLEDTIALRRVINFPPRGIGSKTIDKCVKQAEIAKKRLFDILADPPAMDIRGKQADSLTGFYQIVRKYHEVLDKINASELAQTLIEDTGFIKYYKSQGTAEDLERVENVKELLKGID
ncbi:MAG: UvrD-helicase domain-containing protein, partial [Candidatus Neomarinimicrobiota bacterium]